MQWNWNDPSSNHPSGLAPNASIRRVDMRFTAFQESSEFDQDLRTQAADASYRHPTTSHSRLPPAKESAC
jgi:hypothetical protein